MLANLKGKALTNIDVEKNIVKQPQNVAAPDFYMKIYSSSWVAARVFSEQYMFHFVLHESSLKNTNKKRKLDML